MKNRVGANGLAGVLATGSRVEQGKLAPCPDTPNCVNSQAAGSSAIAPLAYCGDAQLAWARLHAVLSRWPRIRIVAYADGYLRAEARSRVFGFVDDVEFVLDLDAEVIHVRSASRVGYSDFGVNRRRIEKLRGVLCGVAQQPSA